MSIKTNYNFKGIEVKDAIIRVIRIFGSSKEGWNSLVGVYNITTEEVPAVEAIEAVLGEDGEVITPAVDGVEATTKTVYNKLEEFNISASYVEDERGYISLYKALTDKYGGVKC